MQTRTESDSLGHIEVPSDRYWGAQTQRSLENFPIGHQKFPREIIEAFGIVKKAAAISNRELGKLDRKKCEWIVAACDKVIRGEMDEHFPLVVWQTGSGTQSNMNANEVIANLANELAGHPIGSKHPIHPNDDVNLSQSSNDVFPTVMHLAVAKTLHQNLLPALKSLSQTLHKKSSQFSSIVKIGRTHFMDATPLTLGQEFSAYAEQLDFALSSIESSLSGIYQLAIGGTAVGTGLNSHPAYATMISEKISDMTGLPFKSSNNKFMSLAAHDAMVDCSGRLKLLATALYKIANDIRMLASGPRCGIGEIRIPTNEPGSSIMPGKVNPTQAEALTMIACEVIGNDVTVSLAGSMGQFELNAFKPVIIFKLLESIQLLGDGMRSFNKRCVEGIEANESRIKMFLDQSLMLVTALTPRIGYDQAAKIAKYAHEKETSLKKAAEELGILKADEFDRLVNPNEMIQP